MPGSNRPSYGNEIYDLVIAPTSQAGAIPGTLVWSSASVAATTTVEVTAQIPGLLVGDYIDCYITSGPLTTGLSYTNIRCSAPNTVAVTWVNSTGSPITIPTAIWNANVTRPENVANLPVNFI